jgi:dTDP-4-amino-4,6-dideoxygalactose transaminase
VHAPTWICWADLTPFSLQAHGAVWRDGRTAGNFGTIAAFSTMSGKHHATGAQGGVVFSRDPALLHAARCFADRGKPLPGGASRRL